VSRSRFPRQPVSLAIFGFSCAIHGTLALRFLSSRGTYQLLDTVAFVVLIAASLLLSVLKPLIKTRWIFMIAAGLHAVIAVPLSSLLLRLEYEPIAWIAIITAETVVYLPGLASGIYAGLFTAVYVVAGLLSPYVSGWSFIQNVLVLAFVIFGTTLFSRYREELVQREKDVERLDGAVLRLGRANTSYQQYALDAEERSAEHERQRITRDIHDIVGYTLTNSVVTIEAAVDMIRVDPLRVPALLQSARKNAEEGLERIRESLYRLRDQKTDHPKGIAGISRMVRNFGTAASIEVELEIGGIPPLQLGEKVSYVTHHFVQEAIINSFRHGRATRVLVMLYWSEERFIAKVWDNGPGAPTVMKEGIGMSGMRERAAQVEGEISFERVIDGFSITLALPRRYIS
jgi:signal transduction histidine kinase